MSRTVPIPDWLLKPAELVLCDELIRVAPVSSNAAYGTSPTHRGRYLTGDGKFFKELVLKALEGVPMPKVEEGQELTITLIFYFSTDYLFSASGSPRRVDTLDMMKLSEDVVAESMGYDDKLHYVLHPVKVPVPADLWGSLGYGKHDAVFRFIVALLPPDVLPTLHLEFAQASPRVREVWSECPLCYGKREFSPPEGYEGLVRECHFCKGAGTLRLVRNTRNPLRLKYAIVGGKRCCRAKWRLMLHGPYRRVGGVVPVWILQCSKCNHLVESNEKGVPLMKHEEIEHA